MSDDWIRDQAQRHRQEDERQRQQSEQHEQAERHRLQIVNQQLPQLWGAFGEALRQRSENYNSHYGKQILYVEVHSDQITVRGERSGSVLKVLLGVDNTKQRIQSQLTKATAGTTSGQTSLQRIPALYVEADTLTFRYVPDSGVGPLTPDAAADRVMQEIVKEL